MDTAISLFENTFEWLRENYSNLHFFVERDVVWTIQTRLLDQIHKYNLPFRVFNDYAMLPGTNRSISADIAILDRENNQVELAVEFKYEPSHTRDDIPKNKFPVVFWKDVEKDITRIHEFVAKGKTNIGFSVLIDEGGYFHSKRTTGLNQWKSWGKNTWVYSSRTDLTDK
jgi:hypothetical protein